MGGRDVRKNVCRLYESYIIIVTTLKPQTDVRQSSEIRTTVINRKMRFVYKKKTRIDILK